MNFQQSPWGCFIKREGGGLINAGPPEALSLKAFSRQNHTVCIFPVLPRDVNVTSSVRVDTVM